MEKRYSETICGYTVHSYYVDCPSYEKRRFAFVKKHDLLRRMVYFMTAPLCDAIEAVASMFR